KPADGAKPADAPKPADAAKPADAPKPVPPKADAKPAPKKAPPPPPEPDMLEMAQEYLPYAAGGVGVLGLLGLGGYMIRRRKKAAEAGPSSALTSAFPSDLKPNTSTGKPGGGLVDTGNSSFLTDFDKTGPGTIDTDEVDPVAEAEVYIAYGRDAQAEEILKEAMARDRNRHEIPLKLLEIYHARKSATAFETVAKELRGTVGDTSPIWQKAAAMGVQIDPTNPLYVGAAGAEADVASAAPAAKPNLDFDLDSSPVSAEPAPMAESPSSFDLDLGSGVPAPDLPVSADVPALDFDLAPPSASSVDVPLAAEPAKEEKPAFDFDLSGLDFPASSEPAKAEAPAAVPDLALDFDQTITTTTADTAPAASLNLTDLDLGDAGGAGGDAVSTKLELAKAYLEIGDKDGAREILQEVLKEGSAGQKDEAERLIASL
ncbi:MAG TPA: FimV/HubP family polar landmark protein, partial [Usitatibacteraceae bacterium]|nr:FimV/HubP family polar landmark protein [Usitatibacteraceae bacterium]